MRTSRTLLLLAASGLLASCASEASLAPPGARYPQTEADYATLLNRFPEQAMGLGPDTLLAPGTTADHVEIHALLLSSESRRWAATHDEEAARRVRASLDHLLDHRDDDGDGKTGWGMPMAWDAFQDGTVNPANTPYTISTAQVLEGLFDALDLASPLFSDAEIRQAELAIREAWTRWTSEVWTQDGDRGWFWYSAAAADAENVVNVNGMMLSVAARALRYGWRTPDEGFLGSLRVTAETVTRTMLGEVRYRSGNPYWGYMAVPNRYGADGPNDAVHHVYVLWGLERARDLGLASGGVPYRRAEALASIASFLRDGRAYDFPQDVVYEGGLASLNERPMNLWGLGASLAFLGEFGPVANPVLQRELAILDETYGPVPNLRLWPASYIADDIFYPRYGVHVLWGLATITFGPAARP